MASKNGSIFNGEKRGVSGTLTTVTESGHTPKSGLKPGISFVIPKNKLSGALVAVSRANEKSKVEDLKKEDETRHESRKTKWGIDLTQDPAVKRGRALALQTRAEQIAAQLESGILDVDLNEDTRSPSPPPIYDSNGQRINTREVRMREELELERREAIGECLQLNPSYKPPAGYKPVPKEAKLYIPVKDYPGYNFVGLIMGPRGTTQKRMEMETGTKIVIRGVVEEGKILEHEGKEAEALYEDLHVYISANSFEKVDAAVALIEPLLDPLNEYQIAHKKQQLQELAEMNGTVRDFTKPCILCGEIGHKEWQCSEERLFAYQWKSNCQICGDGSHATFDCTMKLTGGLQGIVFDKEYLHLMEQLQDQVDGETGTGHDIRNSTGPTDPENSQGAFINLEKDKIDEDGTQRMLITASGAQPMPFGWIPGNFPATTGNPQLSTGIELEKPAENLGILQSSFSGFPAFRHRPNFGDFIGGNMFHPGTFPPQIFHPRLGLFRGAPFLRGNPFIPPFHPMMGPRQYGRFPFGQPPMNHNINSSSATPTAASSTSPSPVLKMGSLEESGNIKTVQDQTSTSSVILTSGSGPGGIPQPTLQGAVDRPIQALVGHEIRPWSDTILSISGMNPTYSTGKSFAAPNPSHTLAGPHNPPMILSMQNSAHPRPWQANVVQPQAVEKNSHLQLSNELQKVALAPPLPIGQPPNTLPNSLPPQQLWQPPVSGQLFSGHSARMTLDSGRPWLNAPTPFHVQSPVLSPVPHQAVSPSQTLIPGSYSLQGRPLTPVAPPPLPPRSLPPLPSVPPPSLTLPPSLTRAPALAPAPTPRAAPISAPAPALAPALSLPGAFFPILPSPPPLPVLPRPPVGPPLPEAPRPLLPQPPAAPFPGSQPPMRSSAHVSSQPWEMGLQTSMYPLPKVAIQASLPPIQGNPVTLLTNAPTIPKERPEQFSAFPHPLFQHNRPPQIVSGEQSWQVQPPQVHGHHNVLPTVPSQVESSRHFNIAPISINPPWERTTVTDVQRVHQPLNIAQSDKSESQTYDPFAPTSMSTPPSSEALLTKGCLPFGGSNKNVLNMHEIVPTMPLSRLGDEAQVDSMSGWSQPAVPLASMHSSTHRPSFAASNIQATSGIHGIPSVLKESDEEYEKLMSSVGVK